MNFHRVSSLCSAAATSVIARTRGLGARRRQRQMPASTRSVASPVATHRQDDFAAVRP